MADWPTPVRTGEMRLPTYSCDIWNMYARGTIEQSHKQEDAHRYACWSLTDPSLRSMG